MTAQMLLVEQPTPDPRQARRLQRRLQAQRQAADALDDATRALSQAERSLRAARMPFLASEVAELGMRTFSQTERLVTDLTGGQPAEAAPARPSTRGLAAEYLARRLAEARVLVAGDRHGYELAVALAREDSRDAMAVVHGLLSGLVTASVQRGQRVPQGWNSLARRVGKAGAGR